MLCVNPQYPAYKHIVYTALYLKMYSIRNMVENYVNKKQYTEFENLNIDFVGYMSCIHPYLKCFPCTRATTTKQQP